MGGVSVECAGATAPLDGGISTDIEKCCGSLRRWKIGERSSSRDETQRGVFESQNFAQDPEFIEGQAKRGTHNNGVPLNASNGSSGRTRNHARGVTGHNPAAGGINNHLAYLLEIDQYLDA